MTLCSNCASIVPHKKAQRQEGALPKQLAVYVQSVFAESITDQAMGLRNALDCLYFSNGRIYTRQQCLDGMCDIVTFALFSNFAFRGKRQDFNFCDVQAGKNYFHLVCF
jgi:hypothetical protein